MQRFCLEPQDGHFHRHEIISIADSVVRCLVKPGSVALVPTETVYGLVCRWDDRAAIEKIYDLKQRSETKPLALFVASSDQLDPAEVILTPTALRLTEAFCPGPITLIVANREGKTTGFRIPDHPLIHQLLRQTGFPLASTSANRSGRPNALNIEQALAELNGEPDVVIDAGPLPADARASTVIDVSGPDWKILREGPITAADITAALQT